MSVLETFRLTIHPGLDTVINAALDNPVLCSEQKLFNEQRLAITYSV